MGHKKIKLPRGSSISYNKRRIPFLDLKDINRQYRDDLIEACKRVIDSGWYIGGNELEVFEQNMKNVFDDILSSIYCLTVSIDGVVDHKNCSKLVPYSG